MEAEPSRVRALGRRHPVHGVDVQVQAALGFPDGRQAGFGCGFEGGLHQQVTLIGTQGTLRLNEPFIARTKYPSILLLSERGDERVVTESVDAYQLEIEDLATAILRGTEPLVSPEHSRGTARELEAVAREIRQAD
jgi:predicted dehydrogenase